MMFLLSISPILLLAAYTLQPNPPDEPHVDIRFDAECIELGVIPENLAWLISRDYVECEDWSMASHIEPTFVSETREPKWAHMVTLTNPKEKQEILVVYNLDGSLYEY